MSTKSATRAPIVLRVLDVLQLLTLAYAAVQGLQCLSQSHVEALRRLQHLPALSMYPRPSKIEFPLMLVSWSLPFFAFGQVRRAKFTRALPARWRLAVVFASVVAIAALVAATVAWFLPEFFFMCLLAPTTILFSLAVTAFATAQLTLPRTDESPISADLAGASLAGSSEPAAHTSFTARPFPLGANGIVRLPGAPMPPALREAYRDRLMALLAAGSATPSRDVFATTSTVRFRTAFAPRGTPTLEPGHPMLRVPARQGQLEVLPDGAVAYRLPADLPLVGATFLLAAVMPSVARPFAGLFFWAFLYALRLIESHAGARRFIAQCVAEAHSDATRPRVPAAPPSAS